MHDDYLAIENGGRMNHTIHVTVTARELDTILAALRYWQSRRGGSDYGDAMDQIAEEHVSALTNEEIDALCENLNIG